MAWHWIYGLGSGVVRVNENLDTVIFFFTLMLILLKKKQCYINKHNRI